MVNSKKLGFENSFCKELKHSFRITTSLKMIAGGYGSK